MTIASTLLLITADPSHPLATHAYRYAHAFLQSQAADNSGSSKLSVFFYADAAHTANKLRWQSADRDNLTEKWRALSEQFHQPLPVCVSTALTRGITDEDNAKRHDLTSNGLAADNLAAGFELVGLGDLATALADAEKVVSF
ncbi:sulfurtransferase complex subunit TusD [Psychrobacter sp. FDAARGOS_221]|uniref:sulfurtransferase complex subunit TusD n=1 Tax=Psychrobacter sp. FDAARGOS_221 TaxID=1975705 RepID=UPI000BB55CA2|nr:sulfurtransferase complex subunit TusD [Psychrobacter sp. FDAARGOS_221]PNK59450.1 sulfurtransferase complex subunit TusD [Psychrobacter sp. FDAARGOS_221]PNK61737.1 sulfurtransferase complex subunit TusD [Psychrobacter sp. FDAARGOS_221]